MDNKENKLEHILAVAPEVVSSYIASLSVKESSKITYAYNILMYLKYVAQEINKETSAISVSDLNNEDIIDSYIKYVEEDTKSRSHYVNKVKSVKMLYYYLDKIGNLNINYKFPTIKKIMNANVYGNDEYQELINIADYILDNLDDIISSRNATRDKMIFVLLYEIGLKSSECSKLKIGDIDLEKGTIKVERSKETWIYMNNTCINRIRDYYEIRLLQGIKPTDPFIINQQFKSLGVRSIETIISNITNDYSSGLSPAVLRLLCGAKIYANTGDLMQVAKFLGIKYKTAEDHYHSIKYKKHTTNKVIIEMI